MEAERSELQQSVADSGCIAMSPDWMAREPNNVSVLEFCVTCLLSLTLTLPLTPNYHLQTSFSLPCPP